MDKRLRVVVAAVALLGFVLLGFWLLREDGSGSAAPDKVQDSDPKRSSAAIADAAPQTEVAPPSEVTPSPTVEIPVEPKQEEPAPVVPPDVFLSLTLPPRATKSSVRVRVMPLDIPFGTEKEMDPSTRDRYAAMVQRRSDGSFDRDPLVEQFDLPGSLDVSVEIDADAPALVPLHIPELGARLTITGVGFQARMGWIVPKDEGGYRVPHYRESLNDPLRVCMGTPFGPPGGGDFLVPSECDAQGTLTCELVPWVEVLMKLVDANDQPMPMKGLQIEMKGEWSGFFHPWQQLSRWEVFSKGEKSQYQTRWQAGTTLKITTSNYGPSGGLSVTPSSVELIAGAPQEIIIKHSSYRWRSVRVMDHEKRPLANAMVNEVKQHGSGATKPTTSDGIVEIVVSSDTQRLAAFAPGFQPEIFALPENMSDDPVEVALGPLQISPATEVSTLHIDWDGQPPAIDTEVSVSFQWRIPRELVGADQVASLRFGWKESIGPVSELKIPYPGATITPQSSQVTFVRVGERPRSYSGLSNWRAELPRAIVNIRLVNADGTPSDLDRPNPSDYRKEWIASLTPHIQAAESPDVDPSTRTVRDVFAIESKNANASARVPIGKYWLRVVVDNGTNGYAAVELDLVAGEQTITVPIGGPLEWAVYRIIDETGRCDQRGTVFFSSSVALSTAFQTAKSADKNIERYLEMLDGHQKSVEEGTEKFNNYLSAARSVVLQSLRFARPASAFVCKQGEVELPLLDGADWHVLPVEGTGLLRARVDHASKIIRIESVATSSAVTVTAPADWKTQAQGVRTSIIEYLNNYAKTRMTPELAELNSQAPESLPWNEVLIRTQGDSGRDLENIHIPVNDFTGEIRVGELPPGKYIAHWHRWGHFTVNGERSSRLMVTSQPVEFEVKESTPIRVEVPIAMRP